MNHKKKEQNKNNNYTNIFHDTNVLPQDISKLSFAVWQPDLAVWLVK